MENYKLKGTLISGLGEGKYFMSKDIYRKGFEEALNYTPWPGTFNIKIDSKINIKKTPILIKGFGEGKKKFGNIKCYPIKIIGNKNIKAHLVMPEINKHEKTIIEIISPLYLRKALNIRDNDNITIELI
jgi:riboflavin kinase|tara:strand:- start:310 stop:696 length:387 start_codon:yes stop_codon:yes gene_type:complete